MQKLKAAFIFLAPEANYKEHRHLISTPQVDLITVGAKNYTDACLAAKQLEIEDGVKAIELCGGFGITGTARIKEAVSANVVVGVVRFDHHPGLNNVSGDDCFQ